MVKSNFYAYLLSLCGAVTRSWRLLRSFLAHFLGFRQSASDVGLVWKCPTLLTHFLGTWQSASGLKPMVDVISFMGRKNLFLRRRLRNRFCASISLVRNLSNHFRRPMLHLSSFLGTDPVLQSNGERKKIGGKLGESTVHYCILWKAE